MQHTGKMIDAIPPPRQPRPSVQQPPQRRRPVRQDEARSRESRFIGYLVLGFGVLAVLAVLIIAFGGKDVDVNEVQPDAETAAVLQETLETAEVPRVRATNSETPQQPQLVLPREKSVRDAQIQGSWQSQIGDYVAVMQIQRGAFQIILAPPDPSRPRLYSSGVYRVIDDIIALEPRLDWKAPASQGGIAYERLTSGSYPMIAGFKDGAMVWQNVPRGEKRVYVPPRSPLLLEPGKNYIVWKKVN